METCFRLKAEVEWAAFAKHPPQFAVQRRRRGVKGQGIRYEKAVQKYLAHEFSGWYVRSPWLCYAFADGRRHWCQPDGLIVRPDKGVLYVQETKLQHTHKAYFQLQELYYPVLRHLFPHDLWTIRLLEICRWYDPTVPFPGPHRLRPHPYKVMGGEIGVLIWNPRGKL